MCEETENSEELCLLTSLSQELVCHILSLLPLKTVLLMGTLNKYLLIAVDSHLRLRKKIDFCEGDVYSHMPDSITDYHLLRLLKRCPNLEVLHGLHVVKLDRTRLRKSNSLSVPGIIEAMSACPKLKMIETSNFKLLEAVSHSSPEIELQGIFRNRDGIFPPQPNQMIKLTPFLRITSLHLIGVQVAELTTMNEIQELHLRWVSFTRLHPFRSFSATKLQSFVMRQCIGPTFPLRYYPLFIALGFAPELSRLEIVRVPILGGMVLRSVEEGLRNNGFKKLKKIVIGDCKGILESDLGQLLIASGRTLQSVHIQASLTKDSLFASLHFAGCSFPYVKMLYLGYEDKFPSADVFTPEALSTLGLADTPDVPASVTDSGLKTVSLLFPNVENLTITNCPHLVNAKEWIPTGNNHFWGNLKCLIIDRCHCLRLTPFSSFIPDLPHIEYLLLVNIFREPPKGCSHVGLSAGTGLGLSSAIVSNQDEHIAVQGHHVEAVPENDEDDDDDDVPPNVPDEELSDESHDNVVQKRPRGDLNAEEDEEMEEEDALANPQPGCSRDQGPSHGQRQRRLRGGRKKKPKLRPLRTKGNKSKPKSPYATRYRAASGSSRSSTHSDGSSAHTVPNRGYSGPITRQRHSAEQPQDCCNSDCTQPPMDGGQSRSPKKTSKRKRKDKGEPSGRPKNGGTNDPLFEEDVTVELPVSSRSLMSLTIINCGISHINCNNCLHLNHIEVQAARIFKRMTFTDCMAIEKIRVLQCPKVDYRHLVSEAVNLCCDEPVLVYLHPCAKTSDYSISAMEELVMSSCNAYQSAMVLHQTNVDNELAAPFWENFHYWLQFTSSLAEPMRPPIEGGFARDLCSGQFPLTELANFSSGPGEREGLGKEGEALSYPWNQSLRRIYGKSDTGPYELVTNNPIFAFLWCSHENSLEDGWFCDPPFEVRSLPDAMRHETTELVGRGELLGKYYVGVFVNLENEAFMP